jgi:phosphatidylglycerophosphate synthase
MRFLEERQGIPWAMAAARALMGPVLIVGARSGWNGLALAGMVLSALLSDIFDGVLARRWGCDTASVRLFDTLADTVFYLCTAVALWFGRGHVLRGYGPLLVGLAVFEAARFAFDGWKYGKPASYHSYLAKTWGLVLASGIIAGFAMGRTNVLVPVALWIGVACNVEGLVMSLMLPVWHRDVKTLGAAWRLRREWKRARVKRPLSPFFAALLGGLILLVVVPGAEAMAPGDAIYTSGTLAVARGTSGQLDMSLPGELVFRTAGTGAAITIPYASMKDFAYHSEVRQPLGVLPFLVVELIIRQPRKHLYTITYTDGAGVVQVAIFEVPRGDFEGLCAILLARSPAKCRGTCPSGAR